MNIPEFKRCPKCGETKPSSEFNKCKTRRDGLHGHCKACKSAWSKARWSNLEYQINEKERRRIKFSDPTMGEENRRYKREWARQKRRSDPDYARLESARNASRMRYLRRTNPTWRERANARKREWYKTPEQRKKTNERHRIQYHSDSAFRARVRARKHRRRKNANGAFCGADVERQYKAQKGQCYYCKAALHQRFHIDHVIPLSRGGANTPDNIVLSCADCNLSKANKMPHEWPAGGRLL